MRLELSELSFDRWVPVRHFLCNHSDKTVQNLRAFCARIFNLGKLNGTFSWHDGERPNERPFLYQPLESFRNIIYSRDVRATELFQARLFIGLTTVCHGYMQNVLVPHFDQKLLWSTEMSSWWWSHRNLHILFDWFTSCAHCIFHSDWLRAKNMHTQSLEPIKFSNKCAQILTTLDNVCEAQATEQKMVELLRRSRVSSYSISYVQSQFFGVVGLSFWFS